MDSLSPLPSSLTDFHMCRVFPHQSEVKLLYYLSILPCLDLSETIFGASNQYQKHIVEDE